MGSTGAFLDSGELEYQGWKEDGAKIYGIKVLRRVPDQNNPNRPEALPILSHTPGTAYILLDENGHFLQYRQFKENREPDFDIDYSEHKHVKTLHVHEYEGTRRSIEEPHVIVDKNGKIVDKTLYNKYKKFLKGLNI